MKTVARSAEKSEKQGQRQRKTQKEKQHEKRKRSGRGTTKWLKTFIQEYKSSCDFKGLDFETDLQTLYTEVREVMATLYEDFGPKTPSKPEKSIVEMDKAEYEVYKAKNDEEKSAIKRGYDRVKEKIKNIRQDYRNAVNIGSRSGSGKIVKENYDLLTQIWGGSPATTTLPFGVDGDVLDSSFDETNDVNDNNNKIIVTIPEDLTLTETERTVLKKGLTFVPTKNTTNEYQVKADCEKFYRRLRLKAHFHGQDNEPTDDPFAKFNNKISTWTPPQGEFSAIDHYIDRCRRIVNSINFKRPVKVTNLTEEEKTALKHLRQRKDIVIKPADKGGAVVVWSRPLYIQEANRQLSDARFYQHLSHDPLKEYQKTIKSVVNEMIANVELPPSAKHLIVTSARTSRFYLLPKIHKPNNPGRPIVSACNCPTQDISAFLDEIMAPFVKSLPSYVKDTNDALNIFDAFRFNSNNSNTAGRFLFTMDIKSLYTVIPNDGGLQALTYYLDQRLVKEPPTHTLTRLAELVLTLNAFSFNGQIYHQTGGVAMGTKMGPNYACLYVGYFEDQVFRQYTGFVPQLYRRYIDDVIGAASCNREELEGFIDFVSNFNPALQFTYTITERELPFLDITLRIDHDRLQTSVFYKETATHNYLHYNSSHPSHCKRSIPYSQFLRLRRLCSDKQRLLGQIY
ncbi:hypothetical protein QZH41_003138 [Actinostola sp. cb2023]|nr:hypothetical protein QZH41_003138 [Actinostola sp. cb2023]